ncbi:hypothetical protein PINS_up019239 [Pythium insidiosum]|nr:hypothetical protein PINS_up019239 [Pythium insidiosum]
MPFYRTEQVLMVPKDKGTIGRREYLREAIVIQERVTAATFGPADAAFPERVTLEDICWRATGTACTVNSITQYFQNRLDHFDFYDKYGLAMKHFEACLYSPEVTDIQTCTELRAQLKPGSRARYEAFPAVQGKLVSTAAGVNYYELEKNEPAANWEREFIEKLKEEAADERTF